MADVRWAADSASQLQAARTAKAAARPAETPVRVKGTIVDRVPPEVLKSALETIHGTVRVDVRVTVGRSGNVTHARFADYGPSRYFASAAIKAARQWRFRPATASGVPVQSEWLLRFGFTRNGDEVTATEVSP